MSASRKGRVWRGRLAALAVAGVVAASFATVGHGTAAPPESGPPSGEVTLSMEVKPGQPVPIGLITEKAAAGLYAAGHRGQGIDVAVIDSGVAPVTGLDQPGKVVHGPDLSNEGGFQNVAFLDTYGHGTHLAGIIAGDDGGEVVGIAPDSRIVSVKVADATGSVDIAQVIAAIEWVVEHKNDNGLNIRVLNLSLGVDGVTTHVGDPLSIAVERAWDAGIVVVAAAGNRGNGNYGVDSPAISPYVIAVGGTESYDSDGITDQVASWSSGGNDVRNPDVVAPGRSIKSFRVPGSKLDLDYPDAKVGDDHFRGSGTSQSAAVVSGFTAALLSADPSMTPDQVKSLLKMFADDLATGTRLDGSGKIDVAEVAQKLIYKAKTSPQTHQRADGTTPEQTIFSSTRLVKSTDESLLTSSTISLAPSSTSVSSTGDSWSGGTWNGATWSGGTWSGATWSGATWSGATWSGATWSGATWSGATWSGATWSGATWSGATWSGATWSGASWSGATWSGATWSGDTWSSKHSLDVELTGSTWS